MIGQHHVAVFAPFALPHVDDSDSCDASTHAVIPTVPTSTAGQFLHQPKEKLWAAIPAERNKTSSSGRGSQDQQNF